MLKKNCFINSSVKYLVIFMFRLTLDKQLSKIQKILNGLPDPNLSLILKLSILPDLSPNLEIGN